MINSEKHFTQHWVLTSIFSKLQFTYSHVQYVRQWISTQTWNYITYCKRKNKLHTTLHYIDQDWIWIWNTSNVNSNTEWSHKSWRKLCMLFISADWSKQSNGMIFKSIYILDSQYTAEHLLCCSFYWTIGRQGSIQANVQMGLPSCTWDNRIPSLQNCPRMLWVYTVLQL